ncbi:MAG: acyl carrier protein [bacterium]|nr:acyl carrier protein [bacterium]
MNYEEVNEELKKIIIQSLELNLATGDVDGKDLLNEFNINSVDALEILVRLENEFSVTIPDEDLNSTLISSLDNLTTYIVNKLEQ